MALDHALSSSLFIPDSRLRKASHGVVRDDGVTIRMLVRALRVGEERAQNSHRVISMAVVPFITDALVDGGQFKRTSILIVADFNFYNLPTGQK